VQAGLGHPKKWSRKSEFRIVSGRRNKRGGDVVFTAAPTTDDCRPTIADRRLTIDD
jgi:hypothetical protein